MSRRAALLVVLAVSAMVSLPSGATAGGYCTPDDDLDMTSSAKRSVTIGGCAFVDTVTYVEPGDAVRWVNEDVFPHTVTGAAMSWGDEKLLDRGDDVSYSFDEAGVYPYYCALHPTMVGAVVVGDGKGATALGAGEAPVKKADDAVPVSSTERAPAGSGGVSPAALALALVVAAGVVVATRYAAGRRAGAPTTP
ncbi:MAG TPA: plastocyanin/azurin family copper-binding protein [Actinomycetota bacterium]|nr:plastocyanin/azurin family copper-binding protein [Actinomycetota bacterium]